MTLVWVIGGAGAAVVVAAVIHSERIYRAGVRLDRERFQARIAEHEREP
jgi:hypothetical protein